MLYPMSLVNQLLSFSNHHRAFLAQAPLCLVAFTAVASLLHLPVREDAHWKEKLRRIDFLGAFVLIGAVLGMVFGLDRGSNVSWTMPITIASLSVSIVLFILFIVVETRFAAEPFAPGYIVFGGKFFANYGCNFCSFASWLAALFYIPLFFQAVDGVSATVSGVRLLPSIFSSVSGSLFAGFVMKWTGKYFRLTIIAYVLIVSGLGGIFLFSGGVLANTAAMIVAMSFTAFGNGIAVTTTLIALSMSIMSFLSLHICLLSANQTSLELECRRPGRGNCLHLSLPISGLRDWSLPLIHRGPATAPKPFALLTPR